MTHHTGAGALLDSLLKANASQLGPVFMHPEKYHLQVVYTRIDRDAGNRPHLEHFYYHTDTGTYFYPASSIKLAGAALALEKLHDLGLNRNIPMLTDSLPGISPAVLTDSTAGNGLPSVAHYINKILTVSDNDAFNRLYEFIGQAAFNKSLWRKGYPAVQIKHRVGTGGISPEGNRHTNAITFMEDGKIVYHQPARYSSLAFSPRYDSIGNNYYENDQLAGHPMDASQKNRFPLADLHGVLQSIIFPETVTKGRRFRLSDDDYHFLYRCMSGQPEESAHPAYDTAVFPHNYVKFLLFGGQKSVNADIRIFNKPGWAYGFMTDVAYIADFKNNVEFMLSATVYVNDDGILSDRHYQFEETGKPFLGALGEVIYRYELQRIRKHKPDLSRFRLDYSKAAE